jgi:DNA-binding XRE family transcriptional regulator
MKDARSIARMRLMTKLPTDESPDRHVDEAHERRVLLRQIAEVRKAAKLTRTAVAARMGTSEAAVARLEAGMVDPKASTSERFAAAVGKRIRWELVDASD